jgi:hypothetical protein
MRKDLARSERAAPIAELWVCVLVPEPSLHQGMLKTFSGALGASSLLCAIG